MADIKKELNDIKNAVYGREVRSSIHDGIKKINEESEESKQKADDAYEITQDLLDETFDSSLLEANFEQRLDDEIANLQPEWTGFKNDVTSQLAETMKVFNVKETYGALGDGHTDDTNSILTAISDLEDNGGGTLYFPSGKYKISQQLEINSSVNVVGEGIGKTIIDATDIGNTTALLITGRVKKSVSLAVPALIREPTIEVVSSDGFNVGDVVTITDSEGTWTIDPDRNYRSGQLSIITKINGNILTLNQKTETPYTANATVRAFNTIRASVSGLEIIREVEEGSGIRVQYAEDFTIEDVRIEKILNEAIACSYCAKGTIRNNEVYDHGYTTSLGYGTVTYNSTNIIIENNKYVHGRKAVDVSGVIPSRYITIKNNEASDMSGAGFGPHGTAQYVSIIDNTVSGHTSESGITLRGKDIFVSGNTIHANINAIVMSYVSGIISIVNNNVIGNRGDAWTSYAVRGAETMTGLDLLTIKNNVFQGSGVNGLIKLDSSERIETCNISNNDIQTLYTNGVGIEIGDDQKIGKLIIQNNQYVRLGTKYKNIEDNPNIDIVRYSGVEEGLMSVDATKGLVLPRYTTENRPTSQRSGSVIIDVTLRKILWWSGNNWIDADGNIV